MCMFIDECGIKLQSKSRGLPPPPSRIMLRQPQGQPGPDEDGPGASAGGPRQLPSGSSGARRRVQARHRPHSGPDDGVRYL